MISVLLATSLCVGCMAEEIGHVDTAWKMLGPNPRIIVEAFDDPDIPTVTCWVSRPLSGGLSGAVGLAANPSHGSITCHQRGAMMFSPALQRQLERENTRDGTEVFKTQTSPLLKSMRVTRLFDSRRRTVLYIAWSDDRSDGTQTPNHSLSGVPIRPWPQ
ncbi:Conserved uncharacterized protein CreA [invertebrate metagenome]|uniref:Conserved uncharacterized protein CreA n=1 Tax=invertebrate metagenome TaxID=1711999 RepID=A0A484H4H2_9ZZZZ